MAGGGRLIFAAWALLACGTREKPDGPTKTGFALSAGQQLVYQTARRDLRTIQDGVGKPDFDPKYACVSVQQAQKDLAGVADPEVAAFLVEGERLCGLEAWVAYAQVWTQRMEGQRARDPKTIFSVECAFVDVALASVADRHRADPRVVEMAETKKRFCP